MTARHSRSLLKPGHRSDGGYTHCAMGCGRMAKVWETLLDREHARTPLCHPCNAAARAAWTSALEPHAPRCNTCPDGRLLPGCTGAVVPVLTCVDCGRVVPTEAMRRAAA